MKVFLDDLRTPPEGWKLVRWPNEVIELLKTGNVTEISLDHDLGNDVRGTGYDVLLWLEKAVFVDGFKPPCIHIHTSNPPAKAKMESAVDTIYYLSSSAA